MFVSFMPLFVLFYIAGASGCLTLAVGAVLTPRRTWAGIIVWRCLKLLDTFLRAEIVYLPIVFGLDSCISVLVHLHLTHGVKDLFSGLR